MPRRARLDAPGTLHHVIVRGIEKRRIADDDQDRKLFVKRELACRLTAELGLSFAETARLLGVSTSAVAKIMLRRKRD
jgi:DNA-directed RNA polymerase specialized sigma24 family protein